MSKKIYIQLSGRTAEALPVCLMVRDKGELEFTVALWLSMLGVCHTKMSEDVFFDKASQYALLWKDEESKSDKPVDLLER